MPMKKPEPANLYTDSTTRLFNIAQLVASQPVSTSYDIAKALNLPVSSSYLAVNELERLGWLRHDEDGNLVIGPRAQQIALDALGHEIPAQRLTPIVQYLRDQTGETSFAGHLDGSLQIGAFLHGFNPNSITFKPFERFDAIRPISGDANTAVHHFRSERAYQDETGEGQAEFLTVAVSKRLGAIRLQTMVVGICWRERKTEIELAMELLLEVLKHRESIVAPPP
jgi:hypothetical protein